MVRRFVITLIAALFAAACHGSAAVVASGSTGTLRITVNGAPIGTTPSIVVTGPGGFDRTISATTLLGQLAPGSYHIDAAAIVDGMNQLQPGPASQDVTVRADTTVDAAVVFAQATGGTLVITVSGLPSDTAPPVTVTGPDLATTVSGNATIPDLGNGTYTVSAPPVTDGGVTYQPVPASQTVTIAGAQVQVSIQYEQPSSGLTLNVDGVYIDQAAQRYDFSVPLVKDRPGLLRVFVRANQSNSVAPAVRVRFYESGLLIQVDTIPAHHAGVPVTISEGDTTASWNLALPPLMIEPGLQLLVDVDPTLTIPLATRTGLTYPSSGVPAPLDVRTAGTYNLTFVPVLNTADGQQGNVTVANITSYMRTVRLLHPMWLYSAAVHAPFTFSDGVFQPSDQNGAMADLLQQIEMLRLTEGSSGYYYGVMHVPYSSGQVGLGYINTGSPGSRSAVGWDAVGSNPLNDASETYAHELGHNMGLFHAPCGGASSPDPNYPYPAGQVGVYGYNVSAGTVTGLQNNDLMGYCNPIWISDYSYERLITLAPTLGSERANGVALEQAAPAHAYLISGTIRGGVATLNPMLEVTANAARPAGGSWHLVGVGATGATLFDAWFTPTSVADVQGGEVDQFAYVIPVDSGSALDHVTVTGPGAGAILQVGSSANLAVDTTVARANRLDANRVRVTWSAVEYPLLMIRDAVTRDVLAFARSGDAVVWSGSDPLEITASDGVRSRVVRVAP